MADKIYFVPKEHKRKKRKHRKHHHHDEYCGCESGSTGFEGLWVGESGSITVSGKTEAEVIQRLARLTIFI
jgi:hypothetical protein